MFVGLKTQAWMKPFGSYSGPLAPHYWFQNGWFLGLGLAYAHSSEGRLIEREQLTPSYLISTPMQRQAELDNLNKMWVLNIFK